MRKPPPPHPKGAPKTPGSGRKKGSLNKRTIEMRALFAELLNDRDYQHKLRDDFRKRRIHPSTEALIWAYLGKPKETIDVNSVTANVDLTARLEQEKAVFATLSLPQLEQLAAESEAILKKAIEMAQAKGVPIPPALLGAKK